jgi:hypothetical protein
MAEWTMGTGTERSMDRVRAITGATGCGLVTGESMVKVVTFSSRVMNIGLRPAAAAGVKMGSGVWVTRRIRVYGLRTVSASLRRLAAMRSSVPEAKAICMG